MTKREIEIKVRLNEKEAEHLNRQVEKCRLPREAYLRHLIAGVVPREAPPPEYFAFMRELHYVGNLLNQIAQKAHVLNVIDVKRYDEGSKQWEAFIREVTAAVILPAKREQRYGNNFHLGREGMAGQSGALYREPGKDGKSAVLPAKEYDRCAGAKFIGCH